MKIRIHTAQLAKEKGSSLVKTYRIGSENEEVVINVPTQTQLVKELRDKHDIEVWVCTETVGSDQSEYAYHIRHDAHPNKKRECEQYETICSMTFHPGGYDNPIHDSFEDMLEK